MLERQEQDLHIRRSREPRPTVEVHAESLETSGRDLTETLLPALRAWARSNPAHIGTVSVRSQASVNFGEAGMSEYLIVDGSRGLLQTVSRAVAQVRGVRQRAGEDLPPTRGLPLLHVEDGQCWQVQDEVTWFAVDGQGFDDGSVTEDALPGGGAEDEAELPDEVGGGHDDEFSFDLDDEDQDQDEDELSLGDAEAGPAKLRRGRLNAARSDASIGTIRAKIEALFGLPEGSVALCGPDRRPLRADARIGTLRRRWDKD